MDSLYQTNSKMGIPLEGFAEFTRSAAAEGTVLIQNEGQMLPLADGTKISIFGRTQIDYYRSGTGSGGAVKTAYTSNLLDGLRNCGSVIVNEELAGLYETFVKEHPFDNGGGGWAQEPWFQKEMPVTKEIAENARNVSEKALVVLGRTAGEDKDNAETAGSYLLTDEEKEMLLAVSSAFEEMAVILNVSNIIDMAWVTDPSYLGHIKAVLYTWQGGIEGGNAAADVLTGSSSPSGRLADTIAASLADYPSTKHYGSETRNFYQEDIYVGYRYFETFCPEKVVYPFGYGLSYTEFSIEVEEGRRLLQDGKEFFVFHASVQNTGTKYSGKEVLQAYIEAPQGRLGKPKKVLAAFAKTKHLEPGASTTLSLKIPIEALASYDDSGAAGAAHSYVLEAGTYFFHIGRNVKDTSIYKVDGMDGYTVENLRVLEQCRQALAPTETFQRMVPGAVQPDGTYALQYQEVPKSLIDMHQRIQEQIPKEIPFTGNCGIHFKDILNGSASIEAFTAQLTNEELAVLARGEGMGSPKGTPGTASVFGGVGDSLLSYGIPIACTADGPSGIRMESGLMATQLPIGTLLSATFNLPLIEALYQMEGQELIRNQIDVLLGPGMNIRRNPLNGRNFEYYSEDPLITGKMAAAVMRGIMAGGAHAAMKHFACNNQEKARSFVDAAVSERALREIYLKGYELAVKEGGADCIMTSYNPINGHWAASNFDLNTTILREEWGFDGIVMTDWWAKMNDPIEGGEAAKTKTAAMIRAQNQLYMVVNNDGAEINSSQDDTLSALSEGRLTVGELQRNAVNILRFLTKTPAAGRDWNASRKAQKFTCKQPELKTENEQYQGIKKLNTDPKITPADGLPVKFLAEKGIYQIIVNIMSPFSNLAQSSSKILLNGEFMVLVNTNGTDGKWITQKLVKVELEEGYYELTAEAVKPGLTLDWILFQKV